MTQTSTGIKLSISSGIPATYDLSGYGALTYFEIGEVTNIPQFGAQFQTVTNQPLATGITEKRKGFVNYGDPVIDMALDGSNMGQQMMKSACDGIRKSQVHAFMLQYGNGEIRYWSGRVFSFQEAPGSANNMVGATSQIGITRAILQIPRITLDLSFAENFYSLGGEPKNFSDIITFSRSTTATYFNASGVLTTAAINEPCLSYDPSTLEPLGLQVFGAATNLLTYSEQFDNAAWVKTNTTIVANATTAPDGTLSASKVVEGSVSSAFRVTQSVAAAGQVTISVFAKSSGRDWIYLFENENAQATGAYFDVLNGVIGTSSGGAAPTMKSVGNGWFLCCITVSLPAASAEVRIFLAESDGDITYQGDGASGIYIWGAQLETGSIATPYIKTEASQVTRAADIATVDDLSGWYNQSQGSVFVDCEWVGGSGAGDRFVASLSDSTFDNKLTVSDGVAGTIGYSHNSSGSSVLSLSSGFNSTGFVKISLAFKQGVFSAFIDGGNGTSSNLYAQSQYTKLDIGSQLSNNQLNGYIKTLNYYPSQLTENEQKLITL